MKGMKITVLGKGAWGKALGEILQTRGHDVHWVEKGGREIPKGTPGNPEGFPRESLGNPEGIPRESQGNP